MQDIIITEYLKNAKVTGPEVERLVKTLFEQCYALPDDIAKERPSFLNFSKTIQWKGDIINAYIASLAALNSQHGCFTDCYNFISRSFDYYKDGSYFIHDSPLNIPGFGNPINKGQDVRCKEIEIAFNRLPSNITIKAKRFRDVVVNYLKNKGDIRENLVFWNAMIAYSLGLSVHYAPLIFILATQLRYINSIQK